MPTGEGLLALARSHIGEKYDFVTVPKNNPNWKGPWDCAEFASWLVYQEAHILYGCTDDHAPAAVAEAYTGGWKIDSLQIGRRIPAEEAAKTVGAFLLRYPPTAGSMGHIAVSDGHGGTVEAKGHAYGVVADTVHGRQWDTGVLVPGIQYNRTAGSIDIVTPSALYAVGAANMNAAKVMEIQRAVAAKGFDPGPIDGQFGLNTAAAVAAFQRSHGLVSDGQVGLQTAGVLGILLS